MLHWYTYIFPATCILLISLFYSGLPNLHSVSLDLPGEDSRRITRADAVILAVITLLYGSTAFIGLGDHSDPEDFYHFEYSGSSVVIYTDEPLDIAGVRYYCGLNEGGLTLEISYDGENFEYASAMSHNYADIFKWLDCELSQSIYSSVRALRITSDSDLYLGELALYDGNGVMISPKDLQYDASMEALFDEQETAPEISSYMNSSYFDEVYHVRTALEHMLGMNPYEISHPPLGKIIISLGISLFGLNPFGWRFMGTLFGILMLPALFVLLKKMFGGTAAPACGTTIFAFDFMHFVQTRIATVDTYAVFFIILMYLFMYLFLISDRWKYLAWCGVFFGFGAATKWTCLYAGAGLALLWAAYWIRKHKDFPWKDFIKNVLFCIVFFILIPGIIYYCSYYYYGIARGWSGLGMYFKKDYLDMVIGNQDYMFSYHQGVHQEHAYSSRWYQWVLDIRPILYYLYYDPDGLHVSSFGAWLNPVLCWAGLISVFVMLYLALFRRDRRAGFILVGYLCQLVPWMIISRTTFEYHYFGSSVFLAVGITYCFDLMVRNRRNWKLYVFGLTALSVILFIAFYPCLSGVPIDRVVQDTYLGWLPTWPF